MDHKKIETDETLQQKFGYPAKGIPIPRICNTLNNFSNGKVNFHWHTEFQFGLVLKGQVDYWFYENPVSKVHHVLNAGDGFFINSKTLHEYRQIVPGTEVFIFSVSAGFFASSPAFGTIYQDMVLPVLRSGVPGLFLLESSSQDAYLLKLFRQFQALDPESSDYELNSMELICRLWRILYHRIGLPEKNGFPFKGYTFSGETDEQDAGLHPPTLFRTDHGGADRPGGEDKQTGMLPLFSCFSVPVPWGIPESVPPFPGGFYADSHNVQPFPYLRTVRI